MIGRRVMLLDARRVLDEDGAATAIPWPIRTYLGVVRLIAKRTIRVNKREIFCSRNQHRVANTFRSSPSILLLKARTVRSEEIRHHLVTPTSASCRWRRCKNSCTLPGLNERIEIGPI